jgi:ABC-type transport system substrate-binding protein
MRIIPVKLVYITTALLILVSCGRSTETVVVRSDPASQTTPATEDPEDIADMQADSPAAIRYGEWQKITSLDPLFANNRATQRAVQLLYEGLVRFDENGEIVPAHARMWETDRDSLAYTFTLNRNRFFHDDESFITGQGRRVTAGDFKRSFERMASPDVPPDAAGLFRDWIYGFDVFFLESRNVHPGKTSNFNEVEGIIAQNDSTLRIELTKKDPRFLERLASPYAVVYPSESVRHHSALHKNPVGTGPFNLHSVSGDSLFVFTRYENYPGYPPSGSISRIEIVSIEDESLIYRRLATGTISFIPELGPELIRGLVNEDGNLSDGFSDRYRLIQNGQKLFQIAYNPGNRFDVTLEQASSVLSHVLMMHCMILWTFPVLVSPEQLRIPEAAVLS